MSLKIKTWLIAAFAVVVTCSVGVVQWYQLKCMTHLQEEVYVVSKSELARNLVKGARPEDYAFELLRVDEDEPVYQRGFDLYVGEGKDKIQGDFPFFTNDGNTIMIMQDTPVLYNTDLMRYLLSRECTLVMVFPLTMIKHRLMRMNFYSLN